LPNYVTSEFQQLFLCVSTLHATNNIQYGKQKKLGNKFSDSKISLVLSVDSLTTCRNCFRNCQSV